MSTSEATALIRRLFSDLREVAAALSKMVEKHSVTGLGNLCQCDGCLLAHRALLSSRVQAALTP
jgi:hypothetical protein